MALLQCGGRAWEEGVRAGQGPLPHPQQASLQGAIPPPNASVWFCVRGICVISQGFWFSSWQGQGHCKALQLLVAHMLAGLHSLP